MLSVCSLSDAIVRRYGCLFSRTCVCPNACLLIGDCFYLVENCLFLNIYYLFMRPGISLDSFLLFSFSKCLFKKRIQFCRSVKYLHLACKLQLDQNLISHNFLQIQAIRGLRNIFYSCILPNVFC